MNKIFFMFVLSCIVYTTPDANAASSLGQMATNTTADLQKIGPLIEIVGYIAGAVLIIAGLLELLRAAKQPGQPKGGAFAAIIIGVVLLGFGYFAGSLSQTAFGSDAAQTGLNKLGIR